MRLQSCLLLQQMLANLPQHLGLEEESVLATLTGVGLFLRVCGPTSKQRV